MKVVGSVLCAVVSVLAAIAFLDIGFGLCLSGHCGIDVAVGSMMIVSAAWFALMTYLFVSLALAGVREWRRS